MPRAILLFMLLFVCLTPLAARAQSETDFFDDGTALMGQKKFAEAEAAFRKSIHADPRYKEAWEGFAEALEAQGKNSAQAWKMAAHSDTARVGAAPALTAEQLAALGEGAGTPAAPAPATPTPTPHTATTTAPPAPPTPAAAPLPPRVNVPDVPLDTSPLVVTGPDGTRAVAEKSGKPYDGVKVSKYDADIFSPQIACASDGTTHLAYVERQSAAPYQYFVFHRQSSDGGQTWSDTKNLSEEMELIPVGTCQMCVDASDRVYVIWRTGLKEQFPVLQTRAGNCEHNLVYRVLDHGKWSKILRVHPPGSPITQDDGSICFTTTTDPMGKVQVIWNCLPDEFHPEKYMVVSGQFKQHCNGIGTGLVFQATLDGTTPATARELFCANFHEKPDEGQYGKYCDSLDALDAYFDAAGGLHMLAKDVGEDRSSQNDQMSLFEGGQAMGRPALSLPQTFRFNANPPRLLVDAQGKQHIIALHDAGEHPSIRDYTIGSDDDPATLISAPAPKGTVMGFEAFQGPNGKMIVLMQTTDEGTNDKGDSWVTIGSGGAWSPPVCITNNAGREKWWAKDTGVLGGVAGGSRFGPGAGAAAIDKDGHLVVTLINVETGSFGLSAGGVVYSAGSSATPRLYVYRF